MSIPDFSLKHSPKVVPMNATSQTLTRLISLATILLLSFVISIARADHGEPIHFPINLSVPATSSTGNYTATWDGGSQQQLMEKFNSGSFNVVYSGTAGTKSFTGKSNGTYTYYVRWEFCFFGECDWHASYSDSIVVSVPPPATPSAIQGPSTDADGTFTLTWGGVSDADSYKLQRNLNGGGWMTIQNTASTTRNETGLSDGTYNYQVSACNTGGCSSWTATKTVEVNPPPAATIQTPPSPAGFSDPGASASSDAIGATAGTFRVAENGQASYSVPISVPAGTAGVTPALSLNYSSTTQNSIAGVGWSIGGLSAISRCRQTREQDGQSEAITFTSDDRFCLDGQRLIMVTGVNYGDAGSVYRTEIQGGAEVTLVGNVNGGPDYFEVRREDGSLSYYGRTQSNSAGYAKLNNTDSETLTWGIREYRDSAGNSIWFEYDGTASSAQRIKNITYAYGSAPGPSGYNARVEFDYGTVTRQDKIVGYVGGHAFTNDKRLERIVVHNTVADEVAIREYKLGYTQPQTIITDKLSRLRSVEECGGGVCLANKTVFDWHLPAQAPHVNEEGSIVLETGSGTVLLGFQMADINGDGRLDLVWFKGDPGTNNVVPKLRYALATDTVNGTEFVATTFDTGASEVSYTSRENGRENRIVPIDFNADGRQDLAILDYGASEWKIHLAVPQANGSWKLAASSIATSLPFSSNQTEFADLNADGLADAIEWMPEETPLDSHYNIYYLEEDPTQTESSSTFYRFGTATVVPETYWGDNVAPAPAFAGGPPDFNGDGRIDILRYALDPEFVEPLLKAFLTVTAGEPSLFADIDGSIGNLVPLLNEAVVADFNGDGLSDIVYSVGTDMNSRSGYHLRLSNGEAFESAESIDVGNEPWDIELSQTADWNSDGYPDLIWVDPYPKQLLVSYWNPASQEFLDIEPLTTLPGGAEESASLADINGDGVPDYVHIEPDGDATRATVKIRYSDSSLNAVANVAVNRIKRITNGLGAFTDISYEPLSTTDHYDRLEVESTTVLEPRCIVGHYGEPQDCIDIPVQVPDPDSFYETLNGPWWIPDDGPTLGKTTPVLEMTGPYYVVTDVSGSAPVAGSTPGNINVSATSSISYRYGEGRLQAGGRGFLGFMQLTTIDDQSGVATTTRYRQDWPFVGMPIATIAKSTQGNTLSISTTDWAILEWGTPYENTYKSAGSEAAGPVHVVQTGSLEETYALVADGATQGVKMRAVTTATTGYDAEANPGTITITTADGSGQVLRSVATVNEYDPSFPMSEARLSRTLVTTTGGTLPPLVRESTFSYHPGTRNQKGSYYGLLWTETIEPNAPAGETWTLVTTHEYDSWGNRHKSKVQGGTETRCNVVAVVYDSTGRYVNEARDCLGRKTTMVTERNDLGQVRQQESYVSATAAVTSKSRYGALGRPYYSFTETGASSQTYLTTNTADCPASAVIKSMTTDAGGAQSQTCTDVLGRTVRELSVAFDGTWNVVDTEYDHAGRIVRTSEPYNLTYPAPGAPHWTTMSYDLLGRVVHTQLPDSSNGSVSYSGSATALTVTTTNDKNQTRTEVKNVLGQLVTAYRGTTGNEQLFGQVQYEYDLQGNLTLVRDNANNATITYFDDVGRKRWLHDPDKSPGANVACGNGRWCYEYNHFGELVLQTDAKDQTSAMDYDGLGRMTSRIDRPSGCSLSEITCATGNSVSVYDTAPYGLGQLDYVNDTTSGYQKQVSYDAYGRVDVVTTSFLAGVYYEQTTYDEYGRVFQYFDAAGDYNLDDFGIVNGYNGNGYLETVGDAWVVGSTPQTIYQKIESVNARGQVTVEKRGITATLSGGAATITRLYFAETGRIREINAFDGQGNEIQDLDYLWDTLGNLTDRKEFSGLKNLTEHFEYDDLNRLTDYGIPSAPQSIEYTPDHTGNILTKTGVSGSYSYGAGAGPHAVTSFNGDLYQYDDNGNNISGGGRTISYSTFDKPLSVTKSGHTTEFLYGPDRARYFREDDGSSGVTVTRYIGSVEIVNRPDGKQERRRYIAGAAIETTVYSGGTEDSRTTRYTFHDHLGSLDVLTNDQGAIEQYFSFNAWGERRSGTDWTMPVIEPISVLTSVTDRGYTGHEMLDEVGLIHMNGRVYDPFMARFVQADPFVQDPTNSQSLNRYSYLWNNPLNATDPSGHFVSLLVGAVLSLAEIKGTALMLGMMASAILEVAIAGGDFGDMLLAAVSSAAFSSLGGLGSTFGLNGETLRFVLAAGVIGGVTSTISGGKFGHGFRNSAIGAAAGGVAGRVTGKLEGFRGFVARTIAGGTVSELSGGKFRNGAISAAFAAAGDSSTPRSKGPVDGDKSPSVEDLFEHSTGDVVDGHIESEASSMPDSTKLALEKVMRSPLGEKVIEYHSETGQKIPIILTANEGLWFTVPTPGDPIFYTTNLSKYLEGYKVTPGDGTRDATLASQLAHEIGHYVEPNYEPGMKALRQHELDITERYENVYRDFAGLSRRCTYFVENDVCN